MYLIYLLNYTKNDSFFTTTSYIRYFYLILLSEKIYLFLMLYRVLEFERFLISIGSKELKVFVRQDKDTLLLFSY